MRAWEQALHDLTELLGARCFAEPPAVFVARLRADWDVPASARVADPT